MPGLSRFRSLTHDLSPLCGLHVPGMAGAEPILDRHRGFSIPPPSHTVIYDPELRRRLNRPVPFPLTPQCRIT